MSNWLKRNGIHLAIIGIFIALCFVYFSPALQGKTLFQNDVIQAKAMAQEIMEFKEKDGKAPLWTNSAFGGMPTYQIWTQYPNNITTYVIKFFKSAFPNPIDTVLIYLLGAYLLLCVLRMNPWLAAAGAIAIAFSSYNFIIIEAGHSNKAMAIAFFAPIIAGILLTLRGKHLLGASLTALFLAIEIRANHIQMTYYLFIALLIFIGIEIYYAIKTKETKAFFKSFAYLAIAAAIAIGVNAGMLWTTYEYGQESTRGRSNLTSDKSAPVTGLDKEYAYQWSQGVGESITFIVPNAYGGSSGTNLDEKSEVAKTLSQRGVPANQVGPAMQQLRMTTYWGERPFTSGPYYFGAVICFLFILGLFIVKDRIKWWILSAVALSMLLSFGKNMPFISDLFFDYFPLYNKFRAVESTLVIAGLLFPILSILAVKELAAKQNDQKALVKKFLYSLYITGGFLLILIVFPTLLFNFKTSNHQQLLESLTQVAGGDRSFADALANALVEDRISLSRADAIRSLIFILIGAGIIWALLKQKLSAQIAFIGLALTILIDMWLVNKRYLNNESFVETSMLAQQLQPRQVDQLIMRDANPDYRVLDLTTNPFMDARPSYFHKAIGGYHAAKLKRFQEVIDKQFSNSINEDVLDMLNTKYVITSDQSGNSQKIQNRSTAAGNAWVVPRIVYVNNADEEMATLNSFDPKQVAYVDTRFKSMIDEKKVGYDAGAIIRLTNYRPDHLTYEYSAARDVIVVFSEIWYDKGWNAYVDGEKIPHFRADYILRAAQVPGGNHKIEFKFEPASYYTGEKISLIASILLIAGLGFAIYTETRTDKQPKPA